MNHSLRPKHDMRMSIRKFLPACLLIALALLLALSSFLYQEAYADAGGGLPTRTRTPRPTRTSTPVTPEGLLIFPPTSTFTVEPNFLVNPNAGAPILGIQAATPTPEPGSFSLFSCWPFAIVFLAILIVGILWLRSRITTTI